MTVASALQFLRDDKRGRLLAGGLAGVVLLAALLLAFTGGSTRDASLGMLAFRMAGNTLAVLACLYLVLIGLRRWQTQVASITDRQLGIVETLRLSPKQVLHLVRVGNRQLLLGASDGQEKKSKKRRRGEESKCWKSPGKVVRNFNLGSET